MKSGLPNYLVHKVYEVRQQRAQATSSSVIYKLIFPDVDINLTLRVFLYLFKIYASATLITKNGQHICFEEKSQNFLFLREHRANQERHGRNKLQRKPTSLKTFEAETKVMLQKKTLRKVKCDGRRICEWRQSERREVIMRCVANAISKRRWSIYEVLRGNQEKDGGIKISCGSGKAPMKCNRKIRMNSVTATAASQRTDSTTKQTQKQAVHHS